MRVQMKTKIGGYRDGVEWPPKGGVIDVPDHEAEGLIANGYAAPATDEETTNADPNAAANGDSGAAPDAEGDPSDADDAGAAEPGTDDEAAAEPAEPVKPTKPAAKRVSSKTPPPEA